MSNDAKPSENTGEDAANLLANLSKQGVSVDDIIKGMQPDAIHSFLIKQYNLLSDKYITMEEQLRHLESALHNDNGNTNQRIERILALMTSNLAFIKQIIQIEDDTNGKIADQEKVNNHQELQISGLIDRQNRLVSSLNALNTNNTTIMNEIEKLKAKDVDHDKFQIKVISITSVIIAIITWLATGDNLAKLTMFLMNLNGQK